MRETDRLLLAFDTSTEALAVALCGAGLAAHWNGPGGPQASARLLPQARALLAAAGAGWRDLDAVAFGAGPGAFTGLRTACAVAQGLAFGLGCPVIAVDSLMIVAEDAAAQGADGPLWVAMDARMDEVYAAEYEPADQGPGWTPRQAPALYTLPALNAVWERTPPRRLAGSAPAAFGARLRAGAAGIVEREIDRAAALGRLATRLHAAGAGVDAAQAAPLYLRDKVALTVAERSAAKERRALGAP